MKTPEHRELVRTRPGVNPSRSADSATWGEVRVESAVGKRGTGALRQSVSAVCKLPAGMLLLLIRLYQRTLSRALPALLGPGCGCRFYPTCSHYAAEALQTHGFWHGLVLGARRLLRCTPLHPGGYDPVPAKRIRTPACRRYAAEQASS